MTLEKKSTATQELGALSNVIISAADPHPGSRAKVLDAEISYVDVWRSQLAVAGVEDQVASGARAAIVVTNLSRFRNACGEKLSFYEFGVKHDEMVFAAHE